MQRRVPFVRLLCVLLLLLPLLAPSLPASTLRAASTLSGLVFRDSNADGVRAATEDGIAGVTVTVFDAGGAVVGTTTSRDGNGAPTSGALGTWALTTTDAGSGPYRVEFSGAPAALQPGPTGPDSNTTVQFVSGNASNINVGYYNPNDYCGSTARIAVTCFIRNDNTGSTDATIHDYAYSADTDTPTLGTRGTGDQTGTVYGLAYRRSGGQLYASAYLRRGASFGSTDSTGAVYITDMRAASPQNATLLVDLNGLNGINTGVNPHPRNVPGYNWTTDTDAYAQVGKIGLGDLEISDDGQTLYATNLNERTVVVIPLTASGAANTATVSQVAVPVPANCTAAALRPFATKFFDGVLYVGAVCSGPTTADLRAYVFAFDPATNTFTPTPVLDVSLAYPRLFINGGAIAPAGDGEWNAWLDTWNPAGEGLWVYPQPMLTDIEFDNQGFMVLGLRDRLADQAYSSDDTGPIDPAPSGPLLSGTRHGGDILLACRVSGAWQLENAGACNGRTMADPNSDAGEINRGSGPGEREFFYQEQFGFTYDVGTNTFQPDDFHRETGLGSLAIIPGSGEVVATIYDTYTTFEAGTAVYSSINGSRQRAVQVYDQNLRFGKAGGLGDTELICDQAPIEIGNRVWNDYNRNGIQDAGEPGIGGVTVQLFTPNGADGIPGNADDALPIGTLVTATDGTYIFGADPSRADAAGRDYNIPALQPNTPYTIRLNNATDYAAGGPLAASFLTLPNADAGPIGEARDSDATVPTPADPLGGANIPSVTLTTGAAGFNNHTYDVGIFTPVSIGNRLWFDTANDSNDGAGPTLESGVDGAIVDLFLDTNSDGVLSLAEQTPVATQTTASGGYYLFTQRTDATGVPLPTPQALGPGQYIVGVRPSNFATTGVLNGYLSSGTTSAGETAPADPNNGIDRDDNGAAQSSGFYAGGVLSAPVTVDTTTPTGEPATPGRTNQTPEGVPIPDNRSDATVDFGFYKLTIGNQLWLETDNDGLYEPATESPLSGATLELRRVSDNSVVASTTSNVSGQYLFDRTTGGAGIPPGEYYVAITNPPAAYIPSVTLAGDSGNKGTTSGTEVRSSPFTLTPGSNANNEVVTATTATTSQPTIDFGFVPDPTVTLSLGNRVWFDPNNNGILDAGETGLDGVQVSIFPTDINGTPTGPAIATVTTGNGGYYRFDGLAAGNYVVRVDPANFQPGGALAAYANSTPTTASTGNTTDARDNGINNAAPATNGISSAVVRLGGDPTPTSEDQTAPPAGGIGGTGGDPGDARNNLTVDFGFYQPLSLGNLIWKDTNNDGDVDAGEPGQPNVRVELFRDANSDGVPQLGEFVSFVNTDANGNYLFTGLPPGTYIVSLPASNFAAGGPLAGFTSSTGQPGSPGAPGGPFETAPNTDLNNNDKGTLAGGAVNSGPITLISGTEPVNDGDSDPNSNLSVDFGVFQPAAIGNVVWFDTDRDGVRDGGEAGVPNVTVTLLGANGQPILGANGQPITTVTDANGDWQFINLPPGTYAAQFSNLPPNFTFTQPDQGGNDAIDSDVDPSSARTPPVTIGEGQVNLTLYAGLVPTGPTAIALTSFTATAADSGIVIRWTTAAEQRTRGFHVLRSPANDRADAVRLTSALISARGSGSYEFTDTSAVPGVAYRYWLEEVEDDGTVVTYGPAMISNPAARSNVIWLPFVKR